MRRPGSDAVELERGVAGGDDRRGRELGDRDVIGMSVSAVGPERQDNVGTDPPQVPDDSRDGLSWIRAVQLLVAVVEERHFAHAQDPRGGAQLRLTDLSQRLPAGMLRIVRTVAPVAAAVAARRGHQRDFDAFGSVLRERAAHAQGFVIGVREDRHQSARLHRYGDLN